MTRTCTVCQHEQCRAIDRAIVAREPYRIIAKRFGISVAAALRHAGEHLLPQLAEGWQQERQRNNAELVDRLRSWMAADTKLMAACDRWLTDPNNPDEYTLEPRATEVWVVTEEDQGPNRRPLRKKTRLSEILARIDGKPNIGDYVSSEWKVADPRKLVLEASKTLGEHLQLMAKMLGQLEQTDEGDSLTSPQWLALQTRMLRALQPYPEARLALAAALEDEGEDDA